MEGGKIFKNTNEFSIYIESIVADKKITHMEAVLLYCQENYIDPEDISSMINKNLKQKIELNMIEENYLPKKGTLDI
jgi:hypothetical protein